jgi:Flp pilus assembly pilin Flp
MRKSAVMDLEALMAQRLGNFWLEDDGQDLVEYSLLITFIAIACAAIIGAGRPATSAIWLGANSQLHTANTVAAGS